MHHPENMTRRHLLSNPMPSLIGGVLTLLLTFVLGPGRSVAAQTNAAAPPAVAEAAYTQTLEKRVADILAVLALNDPPKTARVHDLLIAQYRALRDWHDANDARMKGASGDQARQLKAPLQTLHARFVSSLEMELTPAQVEQVKDKMTYGKVKVTYDAYCQIVPSLTEPQRRKILELLAGAREEAMDGGSAEEKSAVFNKFKGKINNYLASEGHDLKQGYKDWGQRQKAKSAGSGSQETKEQ